MFYIFALLNIILIFSTRFALSTHLLTPVQNARTEAEERYNVAHKRTRQVIERAFGVTKQRFRCLDATGGELTHDPTKCCKIIVACMILHNICADGNIPIDDEVDVELENNEQDLGLVNINAEFAEVELNDAWRLRRQFIVERFFLS